MTEEQAQGKEVPLDGLDSLLPALEAPDFACGSYSPSARGNPFS